MDTWVHLETWWWGGMRRVGEWIAEVFLALGVSANQITVGRFIVFAPCVLITYAMPGYWYPVAGLACLVVNTLLDCADGVVARKTGRITPVGGWFDSRYDFLMQCCILSGCVVRILMVHDGLWWTSVCVLALVSQAALTHHVLLFAGLLYRRERFFPELDAMSDSLRWWERAAVDIVVTRSSLSILLLTFRYWLVLFTFLGRLEWFLLAIAITQTVRWLVLHIVMARLLSRKTEPGTIWHAMWQHVNTSFTVPGL